MARKLVRGNRQGDDLAEILERPILPKARKLPEPDARLAMKILGWEWEYGVGLNFFDDHNNLSEEATLVLQGTVDTSTVKRFEGVPISLNVYGLERGREGHHDSFLSRLGVGGVQRDRGAFSGGFSMPLDMLPVVLSLIRGEQYPYLTVSLIKAGRLHYDIRRYTFRHSKPEPDDL